MGYLLTEEKIKFDYLSGYKRGVVISEQSTGGTEATGTTSTSGTTGLTTVETTLLGFLNDVVQKSLTQDPSNVSFSGLTDDVEKRKQMTDLSNQLLQKRDTGSADVNQTNFQLYLNTMNRMFPNTEDKLPFYQLGLGVKKMEQKTI
jgi:hypothetical protein